MAFIGRNAVIVDQREIKPVMPYYRRIAMTTVKGGWHWQRMTKKQYQGALMLAAVRLGLVSVGDVGLKRKAA